MAYVAGAKACKGESAYTRDQAKQLFLKAATSAKLPFIYLSAGVSNDVFTETLELAAESGVKFSGEARREGARGLARGSRREEHQQRERSLESRQPLVQLLTVPQEAEEPKEAGEAEENPTSDYYLVSD